MQKYNFRTNNLIIQGDTHSTNGIYETLNILIPNGSDYLQIGDGGWGFGDPSYALDNAKSWLDRINKLCVTLNINCYLLAGNHDNPEVWKLPNKYSNVILVQSGDIGIFPNGKKVLFVGGGVSVDRVTRTEGKDYWKDEITPEFKITESCEYILSHDCPTDFNHSTETLHRPYGWYVDRDVHLIDDCRKQRSKLDEALKHSNAKEIYYGHYHNSTKQTIDGVTARCIDINELYELRADAN